MTCKNQMPLVSVVIPVYNNIEWFEKALSSVIKQTYKSIEIIVVDDGSSERICDAKGMTDSRIRYFRNDNHGVAYSRNYGIKKSQGKYVAFLDSDDFWKKNKIEIQVKRMEQTGAVWSQHSYYYYDDMSNKITKKIDTYKYRNNANKILFCSFKVQTSCFMVKRDSIISGDIYFDENKTFGEDDVFYRMMIERYKLLCIDEYLGFFRIKSSNAGLNIKKQLRNRSNIWRECKTDPFFNRNTSGLVKFAYRVCYAVDRMNFRSNLINKMLYFPEFVIFKVETQRLSG